MIKTPYLGVFQTGDRPELLSAAYSLDQWLDVQRSKWLHAEEIVTDEAPMERMKLLATLYFPELKAEATAVWLSHQQAMLFILESSNRIRTTRDTKDVAGHKVALDEFVQGWEPLYERARIALALLEEKASSLMAEVAGA